MDNGETVLQPNPTNPDKRIQYLLKNITGKINLPMACVCAQNPNTHAVDVFGIYRRDDVTQTISHNWLKAHLHRFRSYDLTEKQPFTVTHTPLFASALIFPFHTPAETTAGLFLFFDSDNPPIDAYIDDLNIIADLIRTVIENDYVLLRLVTTEAVVTTTQRIAHDPHPQRIVEALRDYLLEPHITLCVVALYEPTHSADTQAEHLQIQGDWSARRGSQVISGRRFPVNYNSDELNGEFTFIDTDSPPDAFSESLAEDDNLRSIVLIPLRSVRRKLGFLAIGTNTNHEFHWHELRTYQIVAEFLTIVTVSETLRREHNFVLQGRAALLDSVRDGIVMTLPGEDARVLTSNRVFSRMFHVEDTPGKSVWDLLDNMRISAEVRRNLLAHWRDLHPRSDEIASGEFVMSDDHNEPRNVQWYTEPVYQDDSVIGRIYAFHDVTAERAGERLRTDLLTRVSHELLTPLTSIHGFSQFILEMTRDELPDLAREYTEIILDSARHLKRVFNELIAFTQANAGEIDLYFGEYELSEVIHNVITRMSLHLNEKSIRVETMFDTALPVLYIDIDRTGQVLHNLLENAIKHAPEASTIHIHTQHITAYDTLPGDPPNDVLLPCALVSVIDAGKGITNDEADHIFLPFYRTRASNALKIQGAGLGLAMAKRIVQLQRGRLWVEPATRQRPGGRFYFTLPLDRES